MIASPARAPLLLAAVLVSLACGESTSPIGDPVYGIHLPEGVGNRDLSTVAGTYLEPNGESRLVLSATGAFDIHAVLASGGSWDFGGTYVRFDSTLSLSFASPYSQRWVVTGKLSGDTVHVYDGSADAEWFGFPYLRFVRQRAP